MQVIFGVAYFVVGIVQLFAIMDGVSYATGLGGILGFIISALITYIPLIGSALGVYGAVSVWDWSLLQAGALFFWFVPVGIIFAIFARN